MICGKPQDIEEGTIFNYKNEKYVKLPEGTNYMEYPVNAVKLQAGTLTYFDDVLYYYDAVDNELHGG